MDFSFVPEIVLRFEMVKLGVNLNFPYDDLRPYWKRNFPMTPHVVLLVGWLVGRSVFWPVCYSFLKGWEVMLPRFYRNNFSRPCSFRLCYFIYLLKFSKLRCCCGAEGWRQSGSHCRSADLLSEHSEERFYICGASQQPTSSFLTYFVFPPLVRA